MAMIKCKMCGGDLVLTQDSTVAECEYCGSLQTVPSSDNEKKLVQFERAERLRKNCDFDKAAGVYEAIVADFRQEAEAYWGLVLCKYGIEYVDDPATGKKIPTCHRSSFDSIMEDPNFDQTLENADVVARKVYREEAKVIEEIRKGIIEVSNKEDPYDIFICYKESDENGGRTLDSVLAQDIYDALTEKGYRVFFSRITLEDKLGQEYEPYIFAALNSAKVMIAVGTDYEYYNAVWVKNEWSRYLKLMAAGQKKTLIPCYKGIDAYDMPKEFTKLQAQDMGKVGAMQDLLRGIDKILAAPQPAKAESGIQEADIQRTIIYNNALEKMAEKKKKKKIAAYKEAIAKLESIAGWKDVDEQLEKAKAELKKLKKKRTIKRLIRWLIFLLILGAAGAYVFSLWLGELRGEFELGLNRMEMGRYEDAVTRFESARFYDDKEDDYGSAAEMKELAESKIAGGAAALEKLLAGTSNMMHDGFFYNPALLSGDDAVIDEMMAEMLGITIDEMGEIPAGEMEELYKVMVASGEIGINLEGQIQIYYGSDSTQYEVRCADDFAGIEYSGTVSYNVDTKEYNFMLADKVLKGRLTEKGIIIDGTEYYNGKYMVESIYAHAENLITEGQYREALLFMETNMYAMDMAGMFIEDYGQYQDNWQALYDVAVQKSY